MRICVVGSGIAGSLLAWRLAARLPGVSLVTGLCGADATSASGGLVRGYEPDPYNARLASASLAELRTSQVLAEWARFEPVGSVYIAERGPVEAALVEVAAWQPGEMDLYGPADLARAYGLAGVPAGCSGVVEPHAGYIDPRRLARMVQEDFRRCGGVVQPGMVSRIEVDSDGSVGVRLDAHTTLTADVVVLATGARTGALLRASGLPAPPLRTKLIQYGIHSASGVLPPAFVDESTGLYGRPAGIGRLLLGVPTAEWDADPDRARVIEGSVETAHQCARVRLPGVRITGTVRVVAAVDGYAPDGRLGLREVPGCSPALYTFAGGSGGAAKTALAASALAARQLTGPATVHTGAVLLGGVHR